MAYELTSGDPLLAFDEGLTVVAWNRAAEALTGLPAEDAIGRPCWEVLGATDERGVVCHAGCSSARLLREGREIPTREVEIRTARGRRRASLATLTATDGRPVFVHLLRAAAAPVRRGPAARLTPRELEVLDLLAGGLAVRRIAARLGLAEPTVRNHVRAVLRKLGCHSQLEAVAAARRAGVLHD